MRIAFFHELPKGAGNRTITELGKRLNKHNVVDLYYVGTDDIRDEKKYFNKIYRYKNTFAIKQDAPWIKKLSIVIFRYIKLYFLHRNISKLINKKNYDIVIVYPSQLTYAPFVLRFIKTKKIYFCLGVSKNYYKPVYTYRKKEYPLRYMYETSVKHINLFFDKQNIHYANLIIANSHFTKANIEKFYGLKSTIVPLGVDTDLFKPRKTIKDIDLLFIGSILFEDDEYTLFKMALNFLPHPVKVKVVSGKENWVSDKELSNLYNRSKIVVATGRNQSLGLVPLESMSSETPVVAVNEGGYKETIIINKTGILVSRDPKQIAKTIDKLLSSPSTLNTFGENARNHVKNNRTWSNSVKILTNILQTM